MPIKPKFITFMGLIFCALALSFPIQIMVLFKFAPWEFISIFSKLTPLNYVLMAFFSYTAYLTFTTNKLVFLVLPFLNFFVFLNNFVVAEYGQVYTHAQTVVASTAFLLLTLSFYQKDIYLVYNDLKFRWWLTSPRFKQKIPVVIEYKGEKYNCQSYDISKTGMFIKADDLFQVFKINNSEEIIIHFKINNKNISLNAKIVRKSISKGQYPAGVGVHFKNDKLNDSTQLIPREFKQVA